jgi:hypothetical protein
MKNGIVFLVCFLAMVLSVHAAINATGGVLTTNGEYVVHTFTSNGMLSVEGTGTVRVMVIAGGGSGGGSLYGGGGGAGGVILMDEYAVSTGNYTVVVGAGGVGGSGEGVNGDNSSFGELVAVGGGAGGGSVQAFDGGSGGGGTPTNSNRNGGAAFGSQGFAGGAASSPGSYAPGGGGGAGGVGQDGGVDSHVGNGGAGVYSNISGGVVCYAGGGGGGASPYYGYSEGTSTCGGGNGSTYDGGTATSGMSGTGGGGGGISQNGGVSGDGGSGIVIVSYVSSGEPSPVVNYSITDCRNITENGTYLLENDLTVTSYHPDDLIDGSGSCIDVYSGNVTIDGQGHTITMGNASDAYAIAFGPGNGGVRTVRNITILLQNEYEGWQEAIAAGLSGNGNEHSSYVMQYVTVDASYDGAGAIDTDYFGGSTDGSTLLSHVNLNAQYHTYGGNVLIEYSRIACTMTTPGQGCIQVFDSVGGKSWTIVNSSLSTAGSAVFVAYGNQPYVLFNMSATLLNASSYFAFNTAPDVVSIDGNAWVNPSGTGYSEQCNGTAGHCSLPYTVDGYTDAYPLMVGDRELPPAPPVHVSNVVFSSIANDVYTYDFNEAPISVWNASRCVYCGPQLQIVEYTPNVDQLLVDWTMPTGWCNAYGNAMYIENEYGELMWGYGDGNTCASAQNHTSIVNLVLRAGTRYRLILLPGGREEGYVMMHPLSVPINMSYGAITNLSEPTRMFVIGMHIRLLNASDDAAWLRTENATAVTWTDDMGAGNRSVYYGGHMVDSKTAGAYIPASWLQLGANTATVNITSALLQNASNVSTALRVSNMNESVSVLSPSGVDLTGRYNVLFEWSGVGDGVNPVTYVLVLYNGTNTTLVTTNETSYLYNMTPRDTTGMVAYVLATDGIASVRGEGAPFNLTLGVEMMGVSCTQMVYPNELDEPAVATMDVNYTLVTELDFGSLVQQTNITEGVTTVSASNCVVVASGAGTKTYQCIVPISYAVPYGTYVGNVYASIGAKWAKGNVTPCQVGKVVASQRSVNAVSFPTAAPGVDNAQSNPPIVLKNTGNAVLNVTTTGYDLIGRSQPSVTLEASRFKAGTVLGSAVALQNGTAKTVKSGMLSGQNASVYYWLSMPSSQTVQEYYSATAWELAVSG